MDKQAIIIESPQTAASVRSAAALGTMTVGDLRKALEDIPDTALVFIDGTGQMRNAKGASKRVWRDTDGEWRAW